MTELHWAIVAGAAIVLALVVAANLRDWSQARRQRQQPAAVLDEPIFHAPTERVLEAVLPDLLSEAIARLEFPRPIQAARVEQELRGWRHVGSKPLAFGWIDPQAGQASAEPESDTVSALEIGIVLATRSGPLHAMEYAEWQENLGRLAGALGARLEMPAMSDVLARARDLDQQCARVDAQLTLCVTAEGMLSSSAINAAAQSAGLESRGEARFAKGPLHHQRFSVFPGDAGSSLVLLLDVPRTAEPTAAFQEMVAAAQVLAAALEASVTDESGRSLKDQDLQQIAAQVASRQDQLLALGIVPGSPIAQRLFL